MTSTPLRHRYQGFADNWATLNLYERFEQVVALVLTGLIAAIIVMAVWDLSKEVALLTWRGFINPLDQRTFQTIFGQILTVLIALEFEHSIVKVVATGAHIIRVKTVLLIALLALARKFIILDVSEYAAGTLFRSGCRDLRTWRCLLAGSRLGHEIGGRGRSSG